MIRFLSRMLLSSLVVTAASAAGSSSGPNPIQQFQYAPTGIVHIWYAVGVVTGAPACGTTNSGNEYPYTFDSTTAGGRSMLAGLLAASSAGLSVWAFGTGACDLESGYETLASFVTQPP